MLDLFKFFYIKNDILFLSFSKTDRNYFIGYHLEYLTLSLRKHGWIRLLNRFEQTFMQQGQEGRILPCLTRFRYETTCFTAFLPSVRGIYLEIMCLQAIIAFSVNVTKLFILFSHICYGTHESITVKRRALIPSDMLPDQF